VPCGLERRPAVWLHSQKGVTTVTDGIGDGWKTSCREDIFVPDELVSFDLQQLHLTLHMKGLEGSRIGGEKRPSFGCI